MGMIQVIKIRISKLAPLSSAVGAALICSACVSDTLNSTNTQPEPPTLAQIQEKNPDFDPLQRQQAIAEIHRKQSYDGSGELTNAYSGANGPNEPFTPEQSATKIEALQQNAVQNDVVVGDAELEAKQRKIKELQLKAQTHYDNAVNTIEN